MNIMLQEEFNDYNLHVVRRLKAGQVRELYDDIENGDYAEIQKDKFFTAFDEIFLNLFPDFIERLNELFVPGKELSLLPGKRMTPETLSRPRTLHKHHLHLQKPAQRSCF